MAWVWNWPDHGRRAGVAGPGSGSTLSRLELVTELPGHDSIAAAARALYHGRDGALRQMIAKIETAAGFTIIDRSATPLTATMPGRQFRCEALRVLRAAEEGEAPLMPASPLPAAR